MEGFSKVFLLSIKTLFVAWKDSKKRMREVYLIERLTHGSSLACAVRSGLFISRQPTGTGKKEGSRCPSSLSLNMACLSFGLYEIFVRLVTVAKVVAAIVMKPYFTAGLT